MFSFSVRFLFRRSCWRAALYHNTSYPLTLSHRRLCQQLRRPACASPPSCLALPCSSSSTTSALPPRSGTPRRGSSLRRRFALKRAVSSRWCPTAVWPRRQRPFARSRPRRSLPTRRREHPECWPANRPLSREPQACAAAPAGRAFPSLRAPSTTCPPAVRGLPPSAPRSRPSPKRASSTTAPSSCSSQRTMTRLNSRHSSRWRAHHRHTTLHPPSLAHPPPPRPRADCRRRRSCPARPRRRARRLRLRSGKGALARADGARRCAAAARRPGPAGAEVVLGGGAARGRRVRPLLRRARPPLCRPVWRALPRRGPRGASGPVGERGQHALRREVGTEPGRAGLDDGAQSRRDQPLRSVPESHRESPRLAETARVGRSPGERGPEAGGPEAGAAAEWEAVRASLTPSRPPVQVAGDHLMGWSQMCESYAIGAVSPRLWFAAASHESVQPARSPRHFLDTS